MNYTLIMLIASAIYKGMRPVLLKAVNDPDQDWDDLTMKIADAVFGWKG